MRRSDGSNTRGSRRKPPKEVSLTDPEAAWITRKGIDPFFAYDANYLFDNETGIILNAEGTRANRIEEICDNIATRGDEPHEVTNAYYDMQWRRAGMNPTRSPMPTTTCNGGCNRSARWMCRAQMRCHVRVSLTLCVRWPRG